MNIDRDLIKRRFAEYTADYNADDPKIKLKIDHTYRVADICERIAVSEGLDEYSCSLAWAAGMLHDVGRFEQVRRYGTFSDAASISHAEFGADLLFKEGLIDLFFPEKGKIENDNALEDFDILELAIRVHSAYKIPDDITERERMYCNLLRDADKVDIFRVNVETSMEIIYNVTATELRRAKITPDVLNAFLEGHTVLRSLKKSPIDNLVGHASLAFELVFSESRRITAEQGYLARLLSFQSDDEETQASLEMMREKMKGYI